MVSVCFLNHTALLRQSTYTDMSQYVFTLAAGWPIWVGEHEAPTSLHEEVTTHWRPIVRHSPSRPLLSRTRSSVLDFIIANRALCQILSQGPPECGQIIGPHSLPYLIMSVSHGTSQVTNGPDDSPHPELCKLCRRPDENPFQTLRYNSQDLAHFSTFQEIQSGARTCQLCIRILTAIRSAEGLDWTDLCSSSSTGIRDQTVYTKFKEVDYWECYETRTMRERVSLYAAFEHRNKAYEQRYGTIALQPDKPTSDAVRRVLEARFTGS